MASIQIKHTTAKDVSILARIIRLAYLGVAQRFELNSENCPKHPSNCDEHWIETDLNRGVTYYLLEVDGTAVGCAALEVKNKTQCYLERVAILPENRRQGYGGKLVAHLLSVARELGMEEVGIGIIAKQNELMRWYQRIGFVKGETKRFDHLPFEVLFMAYRIE